MLGRLFFNTSIRSEAISFSKLPPFLHTTRWSIWPSLPTSCNTQVCGCSSYEMVLARRSKRARNSVLPTCCTLKTFDRNRALQSRSQARHTSPAPPASRGDDLVRAKSGAGGQNHAWAQLWPVQQVDEDATIPGMLPAKRKLSRNGRLGSQHTLNGQSFELAFMG